MRNKNAEITIEEVAKIVLAVIGIIVLIVLAAGLYGIFTKKADLEQAKETLNQLMTKLEKLEEGDSGNYLITSPNDWYVISYKKGESSPRDCAMENCLCVCSGFNINDCNVGGVCQKTDKTIIMEQRSSIYNVANNVIIFSPLPLSLKLINEGSNLKITYDMIELNEDQVLFDNFLSSTSDFANKGEISIESQILYYINSGEWGRDFTLKKTFKGDKNFKESLENNIKNYFLDYKYPIFISIREERTDTIPIFFVASGKENDFGGKIPSWPVYEIDNPSGKIKKVIVEISGRR
jgi:Tfp pilus assembly protein PilE